ncbi:MAG TPA: 4Fe-4S dicluster domain-containing protein [Bacillota bacterium]|nr:4Fe-4S dicluster domain-containing protein [Bacillota bacterium]
MKADILVTGGGASGLACAGALARLGHQVALAEAKSTLGGTLRSLPGYLGSPADDRRLLAELEGDLSPVEVLPGTRLRAVRGGPGRFQLDLDGRPGEARAVVLAMGVERIPVPEAHGLKPGPRVLGLSMLAELLGRPETAIARLRGRRIGLFLDGSAADSRRQHAAALNLAIAARRDFAAEVTWFGRDLRVAGDGLDARYRVARDLGVTFFKQGAHPLKLQDDGDSFFLEAGVDGLPVGVTLDLAAIDEREAPRGEGIDLGPARANVRLGSRSPRPGIFLAGSLRADLDLEGCLGDGRAAAAAVAAFLRQPAEEARARVDGQRCARCLTCVRLCPHRAIAIQPDPAGILVVAVPDPAACRGCGVCAAACPALAITIQSSTDEAIYGRLGVTA